MYDAYLYIIANEGIDTESSYKYQGQVRKIFFNSAIYILCFQSEYDSTT